MIALKTIIKRVIRKNRVLRRAYLERKQDKAMIMNHLIMSNSISMGAIKEGRQLKFI